MFLFIKKLAYFSVPVLLIILFPFFIFYFSGEFIGVDKIYNKINNNEPILIDKSLTWFGNKFSKIDLVYKNKPEILALGSSRVLQFRSKFFKNNTSFFNGGGLVSFYELKPELEKISKTYKPKVVILSLNHGYFHQVNEYREIKDITSESKNNNLMVFINSWRQVYRNFFSNDYALMFSRERDGFERIGINSVFKESGMRNDGSYYYGNYIKNPQNPQNADYNFKKTFKEISEGDSAFRYGQDISEIAIEKLEEFLLFCNKEGIYVIGFLPPYAQDVYDKLVEKRSDYEYIFKLEDELIPLFGKYNFSIFNFSDPKTFGATKNEFIDGMHLSEKAYLRLFNKMAESDLILSDYVDLDYLNERLNDERSDYEVFRFEF